MNNGAAVLMMPLSTVYRVVTQARLAAYRSGLFHVETLAAPVISVGNITTGGTGKTPMVEWVCRTLAIEQPEASGAGAKRICVLTRGYGKVDPKTQVLVSDGKQLLANASEGGDEPRLLAGNLIGIAAVISNPDRVAAGEWAIQALGTEVFVLDDGFQHLRLARNLDIVTVDATNPFGGGQLLPKGHLRESANNLSRADCVVITRADQSDDIAAVKDRVRRLAGDRPLFLSRMVTTGFRELSGEVVKEEDLLKQRLGAFCGVGNPKSFFAQARNARIDLAFTRTFPDHHNYTQADINQLVQQAQSTGADGLITTEKDAIRLSHADVSLNCFVLQIRIEIDDAERLASMIRKAESRP